MPPITRSKALKTPSPPSSPRHVFDTLKRVRFFRDFDHEYPQKSKRAIAAKNGIDESTGRLWLKQRKELGSPAYRRTRRLSNNLGRHSKLLKESC